MPTLLRTDKEISEIYCRQVDTVYRVCYSFMKNKPETEDLVQETFLRLISRGMTFENERHEKAWLSRVLARGGLRISETNVAHRGVHR